MRRDRGWILFIGMILLANAAVILGGADGRIEGLVGGVICAVAGALNVVFAFRRPKRGALHDDDQTPQNGTAHE